MLFLKNRTRHIRSLAFSPDGRLLAVAAGRGLLVRIWDLATDKGETVLRGHEEKVEQVLFAPDGQSLVSLCWDQTIVWDLSKNQAQAKLPHPNGMCWRIGLSPDGRVLARTTGLSAQPVHLQDLVNGEVRRLDGTGCVYDLAFAPNGRILAASCQTTRSEGNSVVSWDLASGQMVANLEQRAFPIDLAFSPNGEILAVAQGWYPSLWNVAEQKERAVLRGHKGPTGSVAFAPDGTTVASGGSDGTVRFWDASTGKERCCFDWQIGRINVVAFAPDGMRAAAGGDEGIVIWDLDTI